MLLNEAKITQNGGPWMRLVDPEQAGWSSEKLEQARQTFDEIGSAALMVIDRGAVVAVWGDCTFPHPCHSIRKSILSALYGFNVHDRNIDLQRTLAELQIDDLLPLTDREKEAKIVHLLKARSGVYHEAASETEAMKNMRPIRGSHLADTHWYYNNWDFNALETIFEQETKRGVFEEFETRLACPLHMEDYSPEHTRCFKDERYSIHRAHHYRLSARDLARFGLLYLQRGRWGERQLLSESWIDESIFPYSIIDETNSGGYGYLWWIPLLGIWKQLRVYEARGYGGHRMAIIPKADLILVHRADTGNQQHVPGPQITRLFRRILDAKPDLTGAGKSPSPKLTPLYPIHPTK